MPRGLIRYEHTGSFHFLTFSCYHRLQHLGSAQPRDLFEDALERVRQRYRFVVAGYVAMPEHVLVGEPQKGTVSGVIHALKLSVAMRRAERPFWQTRYYDFLVHNEKKRVEKLHYLHRNPGSPAHELCALGWKPVVRRLVEKPEGWPWSSFLHYATGVEGAVEIESHRTAERRGNKLPEHLRYQE
jgi:REP-associated tyrosine transposase